MKSVRLALLLVEFFLSVCAGGNNDRTSGDPPLNGEISITRSIIENGEPDGKKAALIIKGQKSDACHDVTIDIEPPSDDGQLIAWVSNLIIHFIDRHGHL